VSRRREISDRDPDGGRDPDGAGGGVLASMGVGFPSGEGECSRLLPLWSSIAGEHWAREGGTLEKTKERNGRWFSMGNK
jgi:hypothetical protein